jgi:double-stranded uracil-DNA glycosylase
LASTRPLGGRAVRTHFAHPTNRFYPALAAAGITDYEIDRVAGMTDADRAHPVAGGIGITNLVRRTTARASELSPLELREGGERLRRFVAEHRAAAVAVAGVTAYREAFGERGAARGRQPDALDSAIRWSEAALWVAPNPSGLNAHETCHARRLCRAGRRGRRHRPGCPQAAGR